VAVEIDVGEIGDADDVVGLPALVPADEGDDLVVVVEMVDMDTGALQARGGSREIAAQSNQIGIGADDACVGIRAVPAQGDVVVESLGFEYFLTLEDHGDAGSGEHEGGAEEGAFAGPDAFGLFGMDHGRHAAAAVVEHPDVVVGFGEDDALEAGPIEEGAGDDAQVALGIVGGGELIVERPAVADVPLDVEPHVVVEGVVFGDAQQARADRGQFGVDLAEKFDALVVAALVGVDEVVDGIPPEAVDAVLVGQHEDLVADEGADFGPAEVGAGRAPRGVGAAVVVEIDAAEAVFGPTVELPEVEIGRTIVVVDDVGEDGETALMRGADEALEGVGAAVVGLDREGIGRIVAPAAAAGEFGDGHELDGGEAQLAKMVQARDGIVERGGRIFAGEGADVELVDH
jgi:hypothetical protein